MASTMLNLPNQSVSSRRRKRDQRHLAVPSPSKRLKTGSGLSLQGPIKPSSPSKSRHNSCEKAEKWFHDTNQDVSPGAAFQDNDPPFYINRNPSSDGNSVCAVHSDGSSFKESGFGKPTGPTRSLLARMESSESNSEDFRSVIDDLTIQNKKLKKKLKQYERLHCSHLEQEKLFEVRIHGLAGQRKQELEQTLRSFASSIEEDTSEGLNFHPIPRRQPGAASEPLTSQQTTATGGFSHSESIAAMRKPSSASTSCSKPVDSAYASMSGQTGISQLQPMDTQRHTKSAQASQKYQNVQSYLHDIPETLVPKHTMVMSDRSKSKLVVKRLEQIFTGKGAASRSDTQSHQQQAVSNSAAQADKVRGRHLNREGMREARILPLDADLQVDTFSEVNTAAQQSRQSSNDRRDLQASRDQSPDQRPTRPLDLDLQRAQVPEDNIDYIRHLGLSSPTASTQSDSDDGWVFLNLLINMAQLHTLNVTPEFIRQAVADVSSKFELSTDGTKVRWLGGKEGTKMSSDSEDSLEMDKSKLRDVGAPASTREPSNNMLRTSALQDRQEPNTGLPQLRHGQVANPDLIAKRRPVILNQQNDCSDFHYKPLFFHYASSEASDDSDPNTNSFPSSDVMENATGLNSGINSGSHGMRETEVGLRKQNTENGPIIFYHKARFCTDLSGDPSGAHYDDSAYHRYTQEPLGCSIDDFEKSTGNEYIEPFEPMERDFDSTKIDRSTLDLEDLKSCMSDCFSSTGSANASPMSMEVSGLGGVQPDDNFMVKVQVRHHDRKNALRPVGVKSGLDISHRLRRGLAEAVSAKSDTPRSQPLTMPISSEVVSTIRTELKPSSLPPPSYACLLSSSSGSDSEEDDDDSSISSEDNVPRSSRPFINESAQKPSNFFPGASSDETDETANLSASSEAGEDDDDSIDLLAHARVLDPETIAARERDFDDNVIPSGSVAATAGESSNGLIGKIQRAGSDADSMIVDGDDRSSLDDSD